MEPEKFKQLIENIQDRNDLTFWLILILIVLGLITQWYINARLLRKIESDCEVDKEYLTATDGRYNTGRIKAGEIKIGNKTFNVEDSERSP